MPETYNQIATLPSGQAINTASGTGTMDSFDIGLTTPRNCVIKGITTGSAAAAGIVGEIIESSVSSGSEINLGMGGTITDITSITLTPGDWDIDALGVIDPLTSSTGQMSFPSYFFIGTVAGNNTTGQDTAKNSSYITPFYPSCILHWHTNISITTTYYFKVLVTDGTPFSAYYAFGTITARRRR